MIEIEQSQKSELIDQIYNVALDPERLETLLEVWEARMRPLRTSLQHSGDAAGAIDDDSDIAVHARRAGDFMDRLREPEASEWQAKLATEIAAAFRVTRQGLIINANNAATKLLGIHVGQNTNELELPDDEAGKLSEAIAAATGRVPKSSLLRFMNETDERAVVFHVAPVSNPSGVKLAMVRTSELGWPQHLTGLMRDAFKLTLAEVEIVQSLVEGKTIKSIGKERERSLDTVRSQIRSILAKTETRSQTELIRIVLSLMDVVGHTDSEPQTIVNAPRSLSAIPFETMFMPDGRRYDYFEFGDPKGRPCLYLPFKYGLTRWTVSAEAEAMVRKIRVIVPVRSGYGHSTPLSGSANYPMETAEDFHRLLDHLHIERTAILAIGADLRYAVQLAHKFPNRISGILSCAGSLPLQTPEQYERMGKWHRFILANAHYAPLILPFLVKAGFSMARRIGKERFFNAVNGDSGGDMKTFLEPEVREAMLTGSDICLSDWHIAHHAFARDCIASEGDWEALAQKCPVPIRLLRGAEDPQSPKKTMLELQDVYPNINMTILENTGQLVFFQHWRMALDELETFLV